MSIQSANYSIQQQRRQPSNYAIAATGVAAIASGVGLGLLIYDNEVGINKLKEKTANDVYLKSAALIPTGDLKNTLEYKNQFAESVYKKKRENKTGKAISEPLSNDDRVELSKLNKEATKSLKKKYPFAEDYYNFLKKVGYENVSPELKEAHPKFIENINKDIKEITKARFQDFRNRLPDDLKNQVGKEIRRVKLVRTSIYSSILAAAFGIAGYLALRNYKTQ